MTPPRLEAAEKFGAALHHFVNGVEMAATERNRVAGVCFVIAQDHHHAIVFLLQNTFYSSSFALLRCLFEAYLRGLWLKHCASDAQVHDFFDGDEPPKTMIAEIENTPAFSDGVLSRVKKEAWRTMCAFTHTGGLHLQRWQSEDGIEPRFDDAELEECLNFAELFAAMAAVELVQLSKSGDNGEKILELMNERWPR
jgi:hypothetical protein